MDLLSLRSNNPYLASLQSVAPEFRAYVTASVELLPALSVSLVEFARFYAHKVVQLYNKRTSETNAQYLALCIHDVQLNRVMAHMFEATQDRAIAESYAAAMLFQAIGKTPKCDDQSIFLGLSYKLRGWEKYGAMARVFPGSVDPVGATFGKEFAQLIFGQPSEEGVLLGRSKLMEIGLYTDANLRGLFLGAVFDEEERARVEATCAEHDKRISSEIYELRRRGPSRGM